MTFSKKNECRKKRFRTKVHKYVNFKQRRERHNKTCKTADQIVRTISGISQNFRETTNGASGVKILRFRYLKALFIQILTIVDSSKKFNANLHLEILVKIKASFEKLINWFSINDLTALKFAIELAPLIITIIVRLSNTRSEKRYKKRSFTEHENIFFYIQRSIRRIIQIYSCLSSSTNTEIRIACIYNAGLLSNINGFDINILINAFSPPISPVSCNSKGNNSISMQGDTTNPELFENILVIFRNSFQKKSISKFSIFSENRIYNISGLKNDLYEKGWLSRRLDDESPAVRFEIFMLINKLLETGNIKSFRIFFKMVNEIIYDCFLDENIGIQSLVSEIIVILSQVIFPIGLDNIQRLLPSINDSNVYTRSNMMRIISFSVFENAEALHKAISAILDSPLLLLDEKLVYFTFSLIAIRNSKFTPEIIPILLEQYFLREGEIYHASISIFLFWSIWKSPSIMKRINFDLLLLYPVAKLNFSPYIPNLRIRLSNKAHYQSYFETKLPVFNLNVLNYAFGVFPMNKRGVIELSGTSVFRKSLFVYIGNCVSRNSLSCNTLIGLSFNGLSPIEGLFQLSVNKFTSETYTYKVRKNILYQLEILKFLIKTKSNGSRLEKRYKILVLYYQLGAEKTSLNSENGTYEKQKLGLIMKMNDNLNFPLDYPFWPRNSHFNSELSVILKNDLIVCSPFLISTPDAYESVPFSYLLAKYLSEKKEQYNKQCLVLGNLMGDFLEFNHSFCQCMVCKCNLYCREYCSDDLNTCSKCAFSNLEDVILESSEVDSFSFPHQTFHRIPIKISFNIQATSPYHNKKLVNQDVHIFVQKPQILRFSDSEEFYGYFTHDDTSHVDIVDMINEIDTLNFEDSDVSNVFFQEEMPKSLKFGKLGLNEPVTTACLPLTINSRELHVQPIAKGILRITVTNHINLDYDYPVFSPVIINVSIVKKKGLIIRPISNFHSISLHPITA
ncbi:hypothetical protein HWI79_1697 [Cryptosporidium felis]|nr:hypothetical protein HWI79_1697 [Cryptosporidium felis]